MYRARRSTESVVTPFRVVIWGVRGCVRGCGMVSGVMARRERVKQGKTLQVVDLQGYFLFD